VQPLGKDVREPLVLLNKHDVRYLIVGGFAVAAHGTPRYTRDLDLWGECSRENAIKLLVALDEFGFESLGLTEEDFATPDMVIQLGYEPNRSTSYRTQGRSLRRRLPEAHLDHGQRHPGCDHR